MRDVASLRNVVDARIDVPSGDFTRADPTAPDLPGRTRLAQRSRRSTVPLYAPEFAADPHRYYREMRARFGSLAPVELAPEVPATLVIGYRAALRILNDPDHFPADPRTWEQNIPAECPILPIMQWRPISSRSAGSDFDRYRPAVTASIDLTDLHSLHGTVERIALCLIDRSSADGTADLLRQYAAPLGSEVAAALLGCPPEIGHRIGAAPGGHVRRRRGRGGQQTVRRGSDGTGTAQTGRTG
jgi:cytochrome P450